MAERRLALVVGNSAYRNTPDLASGLADPGHPVLPSHHHHPRNKDYSGRPLFGRPRFGPEGFTPAEHRPHDTGRLVGHRHQDDIGGPARKQSFQPCRTPLLFAPGPQQNGSRTVNQELSQITVATLRYSPEPLLAATGVLSGNSPSQAAN